ncbi:MAG: Delta-aminolevulinic acid dehydratase [Candidatus Heimdallarchaeota archaeon LC_2]|nr:MAG: Delta-aminolevulinic acid dehydratase [Candidatus Heimdallarchaeota archaeon LC_2]
MTRMRRLRSTQGLRNALAEVNITLDNLILPIFIIEGQNKKSEISSMPNVYQQTVDKTVDYVKEHLELGIKSFILFGVPDKKDFDGAGAADPNGPVPKGLTALKDQFGDRITLYSDVCLCEYTSHGHCGIPNDQNYVENDPALERLADAALAYAQAGSDWVAPSNMMDHRVSSIRERLDDNGFINTAILSYSAKFASSYYGPFRDAAGSSPGFGDRKTYQIDYRNIRQPLREIELDEEQGADAVMVKPALAYLDIIARAREMTDLPLYAYNVSGEYSMVKLAAKHGILDEKKIVLENLIAIRRAGADVILTYHASDIAKNNWLDEEE